MVKAVKLMITWALTACPTSSEEAAGIVLLKWQGQIPCMYKNSEAVSFHDGRKTNFRALPHLDDPG